jgi:hypothetical protein
VLHCLLTSGTFAHTQLAEALSKIGGPDDHQEDEEGEGMDPAMKPVLAECTISLAFCMCVLIVLHPRPHCLLIALFPQLATALSKIGGPDDDDEEDEVEEGMDASMKATQLSCDHLHSPLVFLTLLCSSLLAACYRMLVFAACHGAEQDWRP